MPTLADLQAERERLRAANARDDYEAARAESVPTAELVAAGDAVRTLILDALDAVAHRFVSAIAGAVSYTHLDVYKRQAAHREAAGIGAMLRGGIERVIDTTAPRLAAASNDIERRVIVEREIRKPVSYTHLVQILSQIGVVRAGFDSSPTKSKRSKRNVAKAGQIFWSSGKGSPGTRAHSGRLKFDYSSGDYTGHRQNLPKGAWVRAGRSVKPLLLVVRSVRYRRRINLQTVASQVVSKNFKGNFDKALAEALRTCLLYTSGNANPGNALGSGSYR